MQHRAFKINANFQSDLLLIFIYNRKVRLTYSRTLMLISKNKKNSTILLIEKIIAIAVAFLSGVYIARVAGASVFGEYTYILSLVGLFSPLCVMGLNNITTQYVVKYPKNEHTFLMLILIIRGAGAFASLFIGVAIIAMFVDSQSMAISMMQLLALQCLQLFYAIEFFFLAKQKVVISSVIRVIALLVSSLLKILCVYWQSSIEMLVLAHGLSYVIVSLGYLIHYRKHAKQRRYMFRFRRAHFKRMLSLFHKGKWLLMSGFAAVIYLKIDQIMLGQLKSVQEVGHYAAAARLSEFWYVFPILIANAYSSHLFKLHQQDRDKFQQFILLFLSALIAISLLISITVTLLSPFIIDIIFGSEYAPSAAVLSIHIFATIFIFQRAVLSKWLIATKLYQMSLFTHGFGAVTNVLLNILFIPKWGIIGAAWATVVSYMFASYVSLFFSAKTRPFAHLMTSAMLLFPWKLYQYRQQSARQQETL